MMHFRQKNLFFISLAIFFLFISTSAGAATYNHIIAFGDSLSDHNGLSSYNSTIETYGGTGAPASWTNNDATPYEGDVWLDYLKIEWDATLENYAIGGAMTLGHENSGVQDLITATLLPDLGLTGQVANYLSSAPTYDAEKTLFVIWIGGNDCLEFFREEYYTADPNELITDSIGRIITQIASLSADGARNFLILNLPDLAKTPAFNTQDTVIQANVKAVVNNFNSALAFSLSEFTAANEDVEIHSFDAFTYLNETIADNVFNNSTSSYLTVDENCDWDYPNFNGTFDQFLFFDCIHPTTKTHELVAIKVADSLSDDNEDYDYYDDDDDSCFISAASIDLSSRQNFAIMSGALIIIGLTGFIFKKN